MNSTWSGRIIFRGILKASNQAGLLVCSSNSFIADDSARRAITSLEAVGDKDLSGIDAVKRIVEIEAQARKIVEEAKSRAHETVSRASEEAEKARQEVLEQARRQREQILTQARAEAEAEASKSDIETSQLLESYQRIFNERKQTAVQKAVELILRGQE